MPDEPDLTFREAIEIAVAEVAADVAASEAPAEPATDTGSEQE